MSARQKLDAASIQGGLIVAALVGALVQSGVVVAIAAATLIGLSLLGGEIRPRRRHLRPPRPSMAAGQPISLSAALPDPLVCSPA